MVDVRMSVTGHLDELRRRLMWILGTLLPMVVVGIYLSPRFIAWLVRPIKPFVPHLIFLGPSDAVFAYMKVGLVAALLLDFPVILYHLGAFIWPALNPREQRFVSWGLPAALVMFLGGVVFGFYVFVPLVLRFLLSFGQGQVSPVITLPNYIDFLFGLDLPFGLLFELPLVVMILTRLGLVGPTFLRKNRKYAILIIFVVAGALAPPDVFSMLIMAAPMVVLFELSIILSAVVERSNAKEKERRQLPEA